MGLARKFRDNDSGNMAVVTALMCVPLLAAVSLAVDFGEASRQRSNMRAALDAATLSVMSLPKDTALVTRKQKLQEFYVANGGIGTATITSVDLNSLGALEIQSSAAATVKTNIAQLTKFRDVNVGVRTGAYKSPALVEAKFKIDSANGWWGKSMYAYGIPFGSTTPVKLLQIDYTYNGGGDPKGYGTTIISTVSKNAQGNEVLRQVESQVCTTRNVSNFNNSPPGATNVTVSGQRKQTTCTTSTVGDAVIDVSDMDKLYLQMNIHARTSTHSQNPTRAVTLRTDDAATSHHLYVDGVEMPQNTVVDIFTIIPCGQESTQAWEDGGNALPAPVSNADFYYKVTGKCDFSQRPFGMTITQ